MKGKVISVVSRGLPKEVSLGKSRLGRGHSLCKDPGAGEALVILGEEGGQPGRSSENRGKGEEVRSQEVGCPIPPTAGPCIQEGAPREAARDEPGRMVTVLSGAGSVVLQHQQAVPALDPVRGANSACP